MQFTEENVRKCYDAARAFYKGGPKSPNKAYMANLNPLRYQRQQQIRSLHPAEFITRGTGMSMYASGNHLRMVQHKVGNCREMAAVALSFIVQYIPSAPVTIGVLTSPADHAFVIVGDACMVGRRIEDLVQLTPTYQSYIVDVWSGICCRSPDYYAFFGPKMLSWHRSGKRILGGTDAAGATIWNSPTEFAGRMSASTIQNWNPYIPMPT